MNLELLTFKILTWAYLELHLNWVESWALNPGRGSKERTLAQHLPGQVMCALEACHHTSSAGCLQHYHIAPLPATLGGYYYWGHCVVSELISVSDGPAVTSQHATGSHLSHCRNDLNWRKKHTLLRIWTENSKIRLNLLLESNYTSDTSQCFELIKNSLRWVHEGQGLKDCQDVERLRCPGPVLTNANHCLLSCKSAGRAGEWPWVTRVTPHSIVDTFYWYLLAVKLTRQGPLSPPILSLSSHSQLWRPEELSSVISVNTGGLSSSPAISYLDVLWLAANAGNYFKIRGNQSNDYTLITAA